MGKRRLGFLLLAGMLVGTLFAGVVTTSAVLTGNQGCTPGFWQSHEAAWEDTDYDPDQLLGTVFSSLLADPDYLDLAADTLMEALDYPTDPDDTLEQKVQILLRAAVAALLNATHDDIAYPYGSGDIVDWVNTAIASDDPDEIEELKDKLDEANNLGCPLNSTA